MKLKEVNTLPSFSLDNLKSYLDSKGWIVKSARDEESLVFLTPVDSSGNRLSYIVPIESSEEFKDLALQVLGGVAIVEKSSRTSILAEFNNFLENKISTFQSAIKIKFGGPSSNSISLNEAESIAHHSRLLLAHAIDSEIKPVTFRKKTSPQASELSQGFMVDNPQQGSFIFVIRTPFEAFQPSFEGIDVTLPIRTRAILRIARGIQWVSENEGKLKNYSDVKAASLFGINANMAEHLVEVFNSVNTTERYLNLNVNSLFLSHAGNSRLTFKISNREIDLFTQVQSLLLKTQEEVKTIKVSVFKLYSINPQQESLSHKISVRVVDKESDYYGKRISMELPKKLYLLAHKAHPKGKVLELTGTFEVQGDSIELKELVSLEEA